jgi:integrase
LTEGIFVQPSVSTPELRLADDGAFLFVAPLPNDALAPMLGSTLMVSVDGLTFPIIVDHQISLPAACRTIQEAKYFAASISFQLAMSALSDSVERIATELLPVHASDGPGLIEPPQIGAKPTASDAEPYRLASVFAIWRQNHLAHGGAPTTPPYWELLIDRFAAFLDSDDIRSVRAQDIRDYRDHLLQSGRNARTARHADFAAIRALFGFAVERQMLESDPTSGIKFRLDRLGQARRMVGFSDEEAQRILSACDRQTIAYRRWIPWLAALTGGRIATIANLRKQDVVRIEGCWAIRFTRQAGPIKTAASERVVPIHPAIIERGFLDFVAGVEGDRLFFTPSSSPLNGHSRSNPMDARLQLRYNPGRSVTRRLTEWVHSLGLDIGRAKHKDPNHAWRHWFKERAFKVGIPEKIADSIVGHAPATTSRRYGSVSLATMDTELRKMPSPVAWRTRNTI